MDYDDSSSTDDDLPPHNRFSRGGGPTSNGRTAVPHIDQFCQINSDRESQIRHIEQEAYSSILRAFKAQSDAITWEQESLISELRKELRVSDEEHRKLLSMVNAEGIIRRIREWREKIGLHPGMGSNSRPVHDLAPRPTVSASHKKQKTSQSVTSLSIDASTPVFHQSMQASSALKQGPASGPRGKKSKLSMQHSSTGFTGRAQAQNRASSSAFLMNEATPLIGRKVWTRWPADNNFYEAVITDYDPTTGRHSLVYDIDTSHMTWESVNLKEISPEDIRWDGEDPGISSIGGHIASGRGMKMSHRGGVASTGRGRGTAKGLSKKKLPPQNGIGKRTLGDIELLDTETLIKEVEKVFSASHPDPVEVEKARKVLKEHEQALVDAIARLDDTSDGESDPGNNNQVSQGQSLNQEKGRRMQPHDDNICENRVVEGSDGNITAKDRMVGSDDAQDDN